MDIYNEWKKLEQSKFSTKIKNEEIMNAIYKESNSTVSELKKRLGYKLYWDLFFMLICSVGMIWTYNKPQAMLIFGISNLVFIINYVKIKLYHRKIDNSIQKDNDLLNALKTDELLIKSALKFELSSVLILLPFLLIGSILFFDVYAGQSIIEAITVTKNLIMIVLFLSIGFPLVYFFGAKMNKIGFGSYLDKLRKNIHQLELLD